MHQLKDNLNAVEMRIQRACAAAGRPREAITLIGVSKTQPIVQIQAAAELGLTDLGENYLHEALAKIEASAARALTWHFIGRIQSNKTRDIARHFDWVHTIDRSRVARRLSDQRPANKPLNALVQVNIDADPAKAGLPPADVAELVTELVELPGLVPRGLMTILATDSDAGASYQSMAQLFGEIATRLRPAERAQWDTLSMGMSHDLEAAILHGATQVRIGTALFGAREALS